MKKVILVAFVAVAFACCLFLPQIVFGLEPLQDFQSIKRPAIHSSTPGQTP